MVVRNIETSSKLTLYRYYIYNFNLNKDILLKFSTILFYRACRVTISDACSGYQLHSGNTKRNTICSGMEWIYNVSDWIIVWHDVFIFYTKQSKNVEHIFTTIINVKKNLNWDCGETFCTFICEKKVIRIFICEMRVQPWFPKWMLLMLFISLKSLFWYFWKSGKVFNSYNHRTHTITLLT